MRQKSGVIVPCVDISELLRPGADVFSLHITDRQPFQRVCHFQFVLCQLIKKHTLHPFMVNRQEGLLSVFTNRYDSVQISGQLHFKCSHRLSCHERRVTGYDVISCDTPLVTRKTMAALEMKLTGNLDAVIPVCENREQPLLAVYHKRVQGVLFDQLTQNKLKMTDTLKRLSVCYVQAEDIGAGPEEFANINTRDDYTRLLAHVESSNQD